MCACTQIGDGVGVCTYIHRYECRCRYMCSRGVYVGERACVGLVLLKLRRVNTVQAGALVVMRCTISNKTYSSVLKRLKTKIS